MTPPRLVGSSTVIRILHDEAERAARSSAKVLLTGESGVGKDVVARLIHHLSARRSHPFVALNCAGVPDSLLESALFGHARGSFTDAYRDSPGVFERADGGTVFLDEVGEMSLRMQALLLRFLENGEIQRVGASAQASRVDVRVIAATNRNLLGHIAAGQFREDLYYRLNVVHLEIPPLRERREDIPALLHHFLKEYAAVSGVPHPSLTAEALARLSSYNWPGNVRELRNVAERLVVRGHQEVGFVDLPHPVGQPVQVAAAAPAVEHTTRVGHQLLKRMLEDGESFWDVVYEPFMARDLTREDLRFVIARGLEQTGGNYKAMLELFNMPLASYKRFLSFLTNHECRVAPHTFKRARAS